MDKSHLNGKWYWKSARLEFISVEINLNLDWVNHNLRLDSIFIPVRLVLSILYSPYISKKKKKKQNWNSQWMFKWKEKEGEYIEQ